MKKIFLFILFAFLTPAPTALGHAGVPEPRSLHPRDDGGWLLAMNVGVVISDQPTRFICEEAFEGGEGWRLVALGEREWVTFGLETIQRTEDGCNFERVAPLWQRPTDITSHTASGQIAYLSNGITDPGIWLSTDRGVQFRQLVTDAEPERWTGIRFIDASTLVITGYNDVPQGDPVMFTIDIETGTTQAIDLSGTTLTYPYLLDSKAGSVLWFALEGDTYAMLWGDPSQPIEHRVELPGWPIDARLSTDGLQAWVTGASGESTGVFEWTRDDAGGANLALRAEDTVTTCLERIDGELMVCSRYLIEEFDLFRFDAAGEVDPVLSLRDLEGAREDCPGDSPVAQLCPTAWMQILPFVQPPPLSRDVSNNSDDVPSGFDLSSSSSSGGDPPEASDDGGDGDCACTQADFRRAPRRDKQSVFAVLLLLAFAAMAQSASRSSSSSRE